MKPLKKLAFLALSILVLTSITHCKSSKNKSNSKEVITQEKEMPMIINNAYFQRWVAGQEAGGSGINIYFPELINASNYKLISVYFRSMVGDIQSGKAMYFANLKSNKSDLVMSNEKNAEYGNTTPTALEPFPFELKDNECIISYIDNGETKYFQVYNIAEKVAEYYPSAPPKQNKD
ncbi:MAG: hypothetical protein QNK89_02805 [Lacinutrix sp.]|uniref:hypothetical protein n=1 Tax=Lacinutrix sp. TaxID=1937692 RepID=UPI0030AFC3FA